MSIKIDLRRVEKALKGIPEAIDRGVEEAAYKVQLQAIVNAPKDTWALTGTITVEKKNEEMVREISAGDPNRFPADETPDDRAFYQEFWPGIQQPYLIPALESVDVQAEIQQELRKLGISF